MCDKIISKIFSTVPADFLPRDTNDPKPHPTHDLHKILSNILLDLAFVSVIKAASMPSRPHHSSRPFSIEYAHPSKEAIEWSLACYWLASRLSLSQRCQTEWKERMGFVIQVSHWIDHLETQRTGNREGVVFDFVNDRLSLSLIATKGTGSILTLWKIFRGVLERNDVESARRLLSQLDSQEQEHETDQENVPREFVKELVRVWLDQDAESFVSLSFRFPFYDLCVELPDLLQVFHSLQTQLIVDHRR